MPIPKREGDKAYIQVGEFECVIDKNGCIVNPSLLTRWGKKDVQYYIKFLEQVLIHSKEGNGVNNDPIP